MSPRTLTSGNRAIRFNARPCPSSSRLISTMVGFIRVLALLLILPAEVSLWAQTAPAPAPVTWALPIAVDDSKAEVLEDKTLTGQLRGEPTRADRADVLRFRAGSQAPRSGTLTISESGVYVYTPTPNFNGIDSFGFEVIEPSPQGELISGEGVVTIAVIPVNDPPVAIPFIGIVTPGQPFVGQLQAYDVDDPREAKESLLFILDGEHPGLTVSPSGRVNFNPPEGAAFKGVVQFTFHVSDRIAPPVSALGMLVAGEAIGFVADTLRPALGGVFVPTSGASETTVTPASSASGPTPARFLALAVDPTSRRLYALSSVGLQLYEVTVGEGGVQMVLTKTWTTLLGTHLALSPDARTAFIGARGSVTAVNLYPEGVYENGDSVWKPAYDDSGAGHKRVFEFVGQAAERNIVAMGVHPAGDRLFVVFAGSENKVHVNNDLLRSDVGNGTRADQLTDADLPDDFGFITQLTIAAPVQTDGPEPRKPTFAPPVDIKELIYTAPTQAGRDPAVAVGIRNLAFTPDGNCLLLTAVGGQTVRATAFGIMPTTDEGTGGIVVFDVRPRPEAVAGGPDLPWIEFLRLIPTTEEGENTAELRAEIRRKGWQIVHPEVRVAQLLALTAEGINALAPLNPFMAPATSVNNWLAADAYARLQDSFEDYGYMEAYANIYPRDMVGASALAISHFADFGVVALQETNNLGLLSLPLLRGVGSDFDGYSVDRIPTDFVIKRATGKTISGPAGTFGGLDNYRYAYPQNLAFSADETRLFIGMAGGPPRADLSNSFGLANTTVLQAEMGYADSPFAGNNPPPGYQLVSSGFLSSPRLVASAPNLDYDGDLISNQTEAFNRWNSLRDIQVGNPGAMVGISNPDDAVNRVHWLYPDPTQPQLVGLDGIGDDAWLRSFFLPLSGVGYRRDTAGDSSGLVHGAASYGAVAAIERLGQRWHEAYLKGEVDRPYFIVGLISTPGGEHLRNVYGEEIQYGARNAFQVSFPYLALTPEATFTDRPHDFVPSNSPLAPAAAGTELDSTLSPGPRNNTDEALAGFDALHVAKLLRLLTRERLHGRFAATRIELDPAVRHLLTQPALSDPELNLDPRVAAIAHEIDFGSPRFVFRGVRGSDSRSRRDHDSSFTVSFSPVQLSVAPVPSSVKPSDPDNPPDPNKPPEPPAPPGRHTFVVTLPDLPKFGSEDSNALLEQFEVWFPPFSTVNDPSATPEDIFIIRKTDEDATLLKIGEKYRLIDLLDPIDPANPDAPRTITLTVDVDPRETYDWQLAIELLTREPGSLYSLRNRFEYIHWTPLASPARHKLAVMPRGSLPDITQITQLRAETVGFSAPVRYRRHSWVPAAYIGNTRKPSEPRIDPVTGQVIAGEDLGTLSVVAFATTPEGKELVTPPFEIKIGVGSLPISTQPGKILLGTHGDRIQIEMTDRSGRALTIRPPEGTMAIHDAAKAISFPQLTGIDRQINDAKGIRQILTEDSLFDIIASETSGYRILLYERPDSLSKPSFDYENRIYKTDGFRGPVSILEVDGSALKFAFGGQVEEHDYTFTDPDSWKITEHTNRGSPRSRSTLINETTAGIIITRKIMDGTSGEVFSEETQNFAKRSYFVGPVSGVPGFDELFVEKDVYYQHVSTVHGSGSVRRITTMQYEDGPDGRLISVLGPGGVYEHLEYGDSENRDRVTLRRLPWATQEASISYDYTPLVSGEGDVLRPDVPRTTITTVGGAEMSRSYDEYYYVDGALVHESSVATKPGAAFRSPDTLSTKTIHYPRLNSDGALDSLGGRVRREELPDGTVREYKYTPVYTTLTRGNGKIQSVHLKSETSVVTTRRAGQGTIVTTVVDAHQRQLLAETHDFASNSLISRDETSSFDTQGRPVGWTHFGGLTSSITYLGDNIASETDRSGLTTSYEHNALGHMRSRTSQSVRFDYQHDVLGRELEVRRMGDVIFSAVYTDQFSRNVDYIDAMGRKTSQVTTDAPGGGTIRTLTLPGGFTQIERSAPDGQILSVFGNAALNPTIYEYRVEGGFTVTRAIAATATGQPTSEWTETWVDAAGRTVKEVLANGAATQYAYNAQGFLTRTTDPDGVITDYSFPDDLTEVVTMPSSDSGATVSTVRRTNFNGEHAVVTTAVSGLDVMVEQVRLDGLGSTITEFDAVATTSITRGGNGNWIETTTTPDGQIVSTYVAGRLAETENKATDQKLTFLYDVQGRLKTVEDSRLGRTTTTYFDDDQPQVVTSPHPEGLGEVRMTFTYDDPRGLLTRRVLPDETSLTYAYNAQGLVQAIDGSASPSISYVYDAQGRPLAMTTTGVAGPATTTWQYEPDTGRLRAKVYAGAGAKGIDYTYTPAGRMRTRQGGRGLTTTYGYYDDGRLASVDYSDVTPNVSFRYASHGALSRVQAGSYGYDYAYDTRRRPQTEQLTSPHGIYTLARGYTDFRYTSAELSRTGGTSLHRVAYGHDAAGRINRVTALLYPAPPPPPAPPEPPALPEPPLPFVPVDSTFTYGYLAQSDLIERITGPAHTVTQAFQPRGNAVRSRTHIVDTATISSYTYHTDSLGRRIHSTWSGAAFAESRGLEYKYDSRGHLTDVIPNTGDSLVTPVLEETFQFAFDPLGNRLTASRGSIATPFVKETYTTNLLNQYTTIAVSGAGPPAFPNRELAYDDDGNLVTDERWTYTWDAENRLVRQQTHLGVTPALRLDYTYDHQGRRLTKEVFTLDSLGAPIETSTALLFLYDGWQLIAELDLAVSSAAPTLLRTYTWGLDLSESLGGGGGVGGLLAVTTYGDTPATAYPTYDGAGNITQWLDSVGVLLAHVEYGPFGEILRRTGTAPAPFGFSTKYTDSETGFLYYGYRYYEPRSGRWLNRDPLEERGGLNLYAFVGNDPLSQFDALGLQAQGYWNQVGWNISNFSYGLVNGLYTAGKAVVYDLPILAYKLQRHNYRMQVDDKYREQVNNVIRLCASDPAVRAAIYDAIKGSVSASIDELKTEEGFMRALGALGAEVVSGAGIVKAAGGISKSAGFLADSANSVGNFASMGRNIASVTRAGARGYSVGYMASPARGGVSSLGAAEFEAVFDGIRGAFRAMRPAAEKLPGSVGRYADVGGHHVHAKAGLRGHSTYDPKQGFSISQEFMEARGWNHQDMTSMQRRLFDDLAASGRPNTLKEHTRIAVEAMQAGGATRAEARSLAAQSLWDLRSQGVRAPTRIPWNQ